nr:MAG TPA: hypothetical protein [Caudoviricetes sp.]
MYTLKITDNNTVVTSVKEKIVERSNYVDNIQIIVAKLYKEQIDMSEATVYMEYTLPISKKIKITQLIPNNLEFKDDYIQYIVPAEANLTAEAGDIEVSFTFLKLISNEDDSVTPYVRKTQSGIIHISPLAAFAKFDPSEMLDDIDQRLLQWIALQQDMKALSESTYNEMVTDIHINDDKKLILTKRDGQDTGNGVEIENLSKHIVNSVSGEDPDGVPDGVINLDQIPGMQSLDKLLK